MSTRIQVSQLQDGMRTKNFGRSILFCHEVDSTNEWAKEVAMYGAHEGTVLIAETQVKGRGRLGREWISPTGGLWFSLILRPKLIPAEAVKLTFVAGLAVTEVLREMFDLKVWTKWPNDVLVDERKICGILTEMSTTEETVNFVVVGVGINVNFYGENFFPERLEKVATSLQNELGRKIQLEELFRILLEKMEALYELFTQEGFDPILEEWKKYADFLGRKVEVIIQNEKLNGLASDIDREGALVLKLEDGTSKHVFVGDVSLRTKKNIKRLGFLREVVGS